MAAAGTRSALVRTVLPLVACAVAVVAAVYPLLVHEFLAPAPLAVAYLVAAVVGVRTGVGRALPGRLALGVVLVAAPLAYVVALGTLAGGDPLGLALGGFLVFGALPLLLGGVDVRPRPVWAYAPVAAAVAAALLVAAGFLADPGNLAVLGVGGVYLVLAALVAGAAGAAGPARFALGVLWSVAAATGVYFLVLSGAGPVRTGLGVLVTAACVAAIGPLGRTRSAERPDGPGRVR